MDIEQQVQKAATLISQLRALDTDFRIFGANSHRYRIGSPLSEAQLRAFEIKHEIALPPDYRLYLKTVGNGNGSPRLPHESLHHRAGAGPYCGIYLLSDKIIGKRVAEPFPFEQASRVDDDIFELWDGDIPGLLDISTEGCDSQTHLVAQGAAYGTVWDSWHPGNFRPTGLSFTQWICTWAERSIPRVIREKVVKPITKGMTLNEVVSICDNGGRTSYSVKKGHTDSQYRHLRFEDLATYFEIAEDDTVVRIVNSSIVPRLGP